MNISLYIHFPFCKRKCLYCDFYSEEYSDNSFESFLESLCKEWKIIKSQYPNESLSIETIFLGGGTPSITSEKSWKKFNNLFFSKLPKKPNCEITIECNPESFSEDKAKLWLSSGINRLSIGIQSLNDFELKQLGRVHNSQLAMKVLNHPILIKFNSINVDLMFAIPNQTLKSLEQTLNEILLLEQIKHISIYELTISKGTSFYDTQQHLTLPDDDTITEMNKLIIAKLKNKGFFQYEISNFSKINFECKHNLNYWNYSNYIGLGPGAHSFIPPIRRANISNIQDYKKSLSNNKLPILFEENLNIDDMISELIFLGLRTKKGIDILNFENITKCKFENEDRLKKLLEFKKNGFLSKENGFWKPTEKGILFADKLTSELV